LDDGLAFDFPQTLGMARKPRSQHLFAAFRSWYLLRVIEKSGDSNSKQQ
jgi:hypothetical protein